MSARPFDLAKVDFESLRHQKRRRLIKWSLPLVLAAMLCAIKLLSVAIGSEGGLSSYQHKQYKQSTDTYSWLTFLNVIEPWKAPFGKGTAELMGGNYPAAEKDLSLALESVPADQACRVRVNLSLVYERIGDQAIANKKYDDAIVAYSSAAETVRGNGCASGSSSDGNKNAEDGDKVSEQDAKSRGKQIQQRASDKSSEAKKARNNEKTDSTQQSNTQQNDSQDNSEQSPSEDQQQQLQEKATKAQTARRRGIANSSQMGQYDSSRDYSQSYW